MAVPEGSDDPSENPFANLPMFADLAKALSSQGPLNWDAARQFASLASSGGTSEPNPDPTVRIAIDELARIAELHVRDVTGSEAGLPEVVTVTPGQWAQQALEAYRPLFTELATSLAQRPPGSDASGEADDPFVAMMSGLTALVAPSMMGMAVGSMIGRMATRAFGRYDLPIPRADRALTLVPTTIDEFAEAWSLEVAEMRMWVLAQELAAHTLFSVEPLRDQFAGLVRRHVAGFRHDPEAVAEALSGLDVSDSDPAQALQRALGDPSVLLGAVQSPEQRELAPLLDAATAAVVGYVDYVVDAVAARVVGGDALTIAEAVRRRRVEASPEDVFVERLLGLRLTQDQVQRGKVFVAGVVERAGETELLGLFARPGALPTPNELDAPGLWLARLDS
jgi:putative hydrolase